MSQPGRAEVLLGTGDRAYSDDGVNLRLYVNGESSMVNSSSSASSGQNESALAVCGRRESSGAGFGCLANLPRQFPRNPHDCGFPPCASTVSDRLSGGQGMGWSGINCLLGLLPSSAKGALGI